jgi:signal transduction histidine kinase
MLRRLRPVNLEALGLEAALRELCEAWTERTTVACVFRVEGVARAINDSINITIYRVAQEGLTNVARHAAARGVRVTLTWLASAEATLTIEDDGRGMHASEVTRGLGLLGATERAAAVGGRLQVRSAPRAGTTLALRIPLPALPQPQPLKSHAATAASPIVETHA